LFLVLDYAQEAKTDTTPAAVSIRQVQSVSLLKIGLLKGRKVLTLTSQTMKNSIITEAQIVKAIKEYEGGRELNDVCRELGVHKSTFYNWRKKYAGMDSQELKLLKELEDENRKLKHMYAELALDHSLLKDVLSKKI
jgi:putative transposase